MGEDDVLAALVRLGLCASLDEPVFEPLRGGVASDIWRVDLGGRMICVKKALAKLKVDADWYAPVERNAYEAAWMIEVSSMVPDAVPAFLGQDKLSGTLAMSYLPPDGYPLWKDQLRAGRADPETAALVGNALGTIHRKSAGDAAIEAQFANREIFYDIRLEPYLVATAKVHPDHSTAFSDLVEQTQANRIALIHGDVSPKNILIGKKGPVFLDAECATFGDPAFDLAFCLNHLLLKCLWVPASKPAFLRCFDALASAYLDQVVWEDKALFEKRAAALLPGLLLGRVDGKSPVEYLHEASDKDRVRRVGLNFLKNRPNSLADIRATWAVTD